MSRANRGSAWKGWKKDENMDNELSSLLSFSSFFNLLSIDLFIILLVGPSCNISLINKIVFSSLFREYSVHHLLLLHDTSLFGFHLQR